MKKLFAILMGALMVFTVAHAQSIPVPQPFQLFTNLNAIYIPGITTTSFPVTMAVLIPVGKNGTRFEFNTGATNAATTTNSTVWVEYVNIDTITGLTNVVDGITNLFNPTHNGLTRQDYSTNIPPTAPNYGNQCYMRIRSWQNTNELGLFITNAVAWIRE